jgi:secreted trypsin-like serine protease
MRPTPYFLAATCLAAALPASAILIRADRDDAEYLELASRYESSLPLGAVDGEGVLIHPRWVLTAAHLARALQELKALPKLRIGERDYEIQSIVLHPDWKKGAPANDIALIVLRKSVDRAAPTLLYRDTDEQGKPVVIVGHGPSGKIGAKERTLDRKKRAAVNTVDKTLPRSLEVQVKAGDDASDLQGAATAGDSGAPLYIETPDGLFVAGIGSAIEGDWERYARVSAYVPWIEAVMLDHAKKELESLLDPDRR